MFRKLGFHRFWLPCFVAITFLCALGWARSRDPFKRIEISLCTESGRAIDAMAVLPKPVGKRPVAIFLHGVRGSLIKSGNDLRRFAELGLAAVGLEYDQASQTNFNEELTALCHHLQRQKWVQTNAIAWVGFSLGAQRSLSFGITQTNHQPNLMVRVAGGWVPELESQFEVDSDQASAAQQHSTFNAQRSTLNTQPDESLLTSAATVNRNGRLPERLSTLNHQPSTLPLSAFLIVHGEKDRTFPLAESERLVGLLRSNNVPVQMIVLPAQGHAFGEDRPVVMRGVAEYVARFFGSPPRVKTNVLPSKWFYWIPVFAMTGSGMFYGVVALRRWSRGGRERPAKVAQAARLRPAAGAPSRGAGETPALRFGTNSVLWIVAWLVFTVAMLQTALHLGLPRLKASDWTVQQARRWIVREPLKADFDFLAGQSYWRRHRLSGLLTHVELGDLQRTHFHPNDLALYQQFILSPAIDEASLTELNWRRPLWENFYPRIRKQKDPQTAAEFVVRFLRERVTITPTASGNQGIRTIWREQVTDESGFERIYVAALRSVGVAARLNDGGLTEIWTGSQWGRAPRPLIASWMPGDP